MSEPVLCYIGGCDWAYFTTAPLDQTWGDDWNDAPYEHNAGTPYEWSVDGKEARYEIIRVAFITNLETPADMAPGGNSRYSVEMINKGMVAWLMPSPWSTYNENVKPIFAGTSLTEFTQRIIEYGGEVYAKVQS